MSQLYGRLILTGCQVRMARAANRWSVEELARQSGVSEKTIRRIEKVFGIPQSVTVDIFLKLQNCFEANGLSFIPEDGSPEGPGVRFGQYPGRQVRPHAGPIPAVRSKTKAAPSPAR